MKKLTKKNKPTILDVTPEIVSQVLENDLRALHILGVSIGTANTILNSLIEAYGELFGVYLYGKLRARMELSIPDLSKVTNRNVRTIERRLTKITDIDIPLTITESEEPLPELTIEIPIIPLCLPEEQMPKNTQ